MDSARKIIDIMSSRWGKQITIEKCDLMQSPLTQVSIPEGAIIYTNHAVEMMHRPAIEIVHDFIMLKPKIVVHFEPFADMCDCTTIYGQRCMLYFTINKYNTSFSSALRDLDGKYIEIIDEESNVFGNDPFLPKSMIAWRPKL